MSPSRAPNPFSPYVGNRFPNRPCVGAQERGEHSPVHARAVEGAHPGASAPGPRGLHYSWEETTPTSAQCDWLGTYGLSNDCHLSSSATVHVPIEIRSAKPDKWRQYATKTSEPGSGTSPLLPRARPVIRSAWSEHRARRREPQRSSFHEDPTFLRYLSVNLQIFFTF